MSQVNSAATSLDNIGISPILGGAAFLILSAFILSGGGKSAAKAAEKIVPIVSLLYILTAVYVIIINGSNVTYALNKIVVSAFENIGFRQITGGVSGTIIKNSLNVGLRRGVFSNEAGMGSSVFAHTSADCSDPKTMGMWAVLEVFIDTVLCCTLTALVIICTGGDTSGLDGADMVIFSFEQGLGKGAAYFIAAANFLFALAAMTGWFYYGEKCTEYLSSKGQCKHFSMLYRIAYLAAVIPGAVLSLNLIWELADILNGIMLLINISAVIILNKEIPSEN
jgi:AGCS family alanine or glycine:cation symporter